MMDQANTDARLEADEGTGPTRNGRCLVYDDASGRPILPGTICHGHPTIGFGRALDVNGISMAEALILLHNSEADVCAQLDAAFPWWRQQNDVRQAVLISLAFNMGINGLRGFPSMLSYWQANDFPNAVVQLKNSRWWGQVGQRGPILANLLLTGVWQ